MMSPLKTVARLLRPWRGRRWGSLQAGPAGLSEGAIDAERRGQAETDLLDEQAEGLHLPGVQDQGGIRQREAEPAIPRGRDIQGQQAGADEPENTARPFKNSLIHVSPPLRVLRAAIPRAGRVAGLPTGRRARRVPWLRHRAARYR